MTRVPVDPLVEVVNEPLASTCVSMKKTAAYFQAECTVTSLHGHVRLLNALSEVVGTQSVSLVKQLVQVLFPAACKGIAEVVFKLVLASLSRFLSTA